MCDAGHDDPIVDAVEDDIRGGTTIGSRIGVRDHAGIHRQADADRKQRNERGDRFRLSAITSGFRRPSRPTAAALSRRA